MTSPELPRVENPGVIDPIPQIPEIIWDDPLAVITYARSTKAIVIDTDETGLFRQRTFPVPPGQSFDELEGRARRMDNFGDVEVRHVQISLSKLVSFPSITGQDSVGFRYIYDSPEGRKSDLVDNEHILDFLVDRGGGILTFEGKEKDQELAIFFEGTHEPKATVLFFHPNYDMAGLDSFTGFQAFFRSLNIEMASLIGDPKLRKYLAEFDKEIIEGDTYHDMDAVLEFFRARVVASLLKYEQTHDERYLEFPYSQFKNGVIDLLDDNNTDPQQALNELLWTDQIIERPAPRVKVAPVVYTQMDKEMVAHLRTLEAKRLRETVTSPRAIGGYKLMAAYLTKVYELIRSGNPLAQNDALTLIQELAGSSMGGRRLAYKIGRTKIQIEQDQYYIDSDYSSEGQFSDLLFELTQKVLDAQDEARQKQLMEGLDE